MAGTLVVRGIARSFGAFRAVQDLSLELAPGQVHSLIGPNGAGKTTAFNCISGFLRPDAGSVRLNGADVSGWAPHRLVAAGLARTFQITQVFGELSVLENVALAARSRAGSNLNMWSRTQSAGMEILERLGLAERAQSSAEHLAHGEKRVLEIAIGLALRPSVLLLDEPTAGMSSGETERVARLIRELAAEASVLLVEHDMEIVLGISDVITVMTQGSVIAHGTPAQISRDPKVQEAYLGAETL